jgi:hypothetical protein
MPLRDAFGMIIWSTGWVVLFLTLAVVATRSLAQATKALAVVALLLFALGFFLGFSQGHFLLPGWLFALYSYAAVAATVTAVIAIRKQQWSLRASWKILVALYSPILLMVLNRH